MTCCKVKAESCQDKEEVEATVDWVKPVQASGGKSQSSMCMLLLMPACSGCGGIKCYAVQATIFDCCNRFVLASTTQVFALSGMCNAAECGDCKAYNTNP